MRNNLFESAVFKLTMSYVLILMSLSLSFSVVIYTTSSMEVRQAFEKIDIKRSGDEFELFFDKETNNDPKIVKQRLERIDKINRQLLNQLTFLNLMVLILGTVVSYLLAKKTLEPININYQLQAQFTSDAAHELKTPLTALRMENEIHLNDKKLNIKKARQLLNNNLATIDDMNVLINQLLVLASAEKITTSAINLKSTGDSAIHRVYSRAKDKKIKLKNEFMSIKVDFNHDYLVNLLVIFLDNAIKYSNSETEIKLINKTGTGRAIIMVVDQGVGVKDSEKQKIFERFYRIDKARNKRISGCGLGLSIAKKISDQYNLRLNFKSNKKQGSIVIFSLPIVK